MFYLLVLGVIGVVGLVFIGVKIYVWLFEIDILLIDILLL